MSEQTLAQINQCFVYKLPPRASSRGYRAADWNASEPLWQGRLKVNSKGDACIVQLIVSSSGELFAVCPVDDTAVEPVTDSSRYFVLRIENQGKHAFIGLGFAERNEAFDFNVALQDHKKYLRHKAESAAAAKVAASKPDVDFTLKGPIKVALNVPGAAAKASKLADDDDDSGDDGDFAGLLAPPPKAKTAVSAPAGSGAAASGGDFFGGGGGASDSLDPFAGAFGGGSSKPAAKPSADWTSF